MRVIIMGYSQVDGNVCRIVTADKTKRTTGLGKVPIWEVVKVEHRLLYHRPDSNQLTRLGVLDNYEGFTVYDCPAGMDHTLVSADEAKATEIQQNADAEYQSDMEQAAFEREMDREDSFY